MTVSVDGSPDSGRNFYLHHLLRHKLLVEAILDLDELGVRALLNDLSLLEHDDVVCVADG